MNLTQIFGVFSRRHEALDAVNKPLPPEFRHRVLQLCLEAFSGYQGFGHAPSISLFWSEIHDKLRYLHGRPSLTDIPGISTHEDVYSFLVQCSDKHFFDFVEMIFQSSLLWQLPKFVNSQDPYPQAGNPQELVDSVNHFLEIDSLPYFLTGFVIPRDKPVNAQEINRTPLRPSGPSKIEAYPQVILRESYVLHTNAIEPALVLLTRPSLREASNEFLEALAHYRKAEYADCLSKCGSAFESVMKVICDRKSWPYKQSDTASTLLGTILPKTSLDSFFKEPLTLIATIRNRLSSAHGAGTEQRVVSKHVANYAINATASVVLLLVEETNP